MKIEKGDGEGERQRCPGLAWHSQTGLGGGGWGVLRQTQHAYISGA